MAVWGDGDPRWIVEKRPDATNVNNWHWTEKNASKWSRDKFSELFIGTKIETEFGCIEIEEISKCEGYAVVSNRKAKLIFFYEWEIEMKWKGYLCDIEVTGQIVILNLSEEVGTESIDVIIAADKLQPEVNIFENVKNVFETLIRNKFSLYVTELKEDFSKDIILPSNVPILEKKIIKKVANEPNICSASTTVKEICSVELEGSDINITETFNCSAAEFYNSMTTRELVTAFTQDSCILNDTEGGEFQLFGGNVKGYFTKLEPFKTIAMKWRFKSWPDFCYSDVIITITEMSDCTEVKLKQSGIPKGYLDNTRDGWKKHYWDNIKRTFGFGTFLL